MATPTIDVTVKLYGPVRPGAPDSSAEERRTVPDGTVAGQLLRELGVRHEAEVAVLIDGRVVDWAWLLRDGDVLNVIPALAGGAN